MSESETDDVLYVVDETLAEALDDVAAIERHRERIRELLDEDAAAWQFCVL